MPNFIEATWPVNQVTFCCREEEGVLVMLAVQRPPNLAVGAAIIVQGPDGRRCVASTQSRNPRRTRLAPELIHGRLHTGFERKYRLGWPWAARSMLRFRAPSPTYRWLYH